MGKGLLQARSYYPTEFENCETTAEFCLKFNNLFDVLNRTKDGLQDGSRDFTVSYFKVLFINIEDISLSIKKCFFVGT